MSAHRRLLHFSYALPVFIVLLGLLVASSVSADPVVNRIVGESVVLPAGLSPQDNPSEVEWGWGEKTIALSDENENVSVEQFRDRLHLNRTDWSLTINLLRAEDSGEYKRIARAASGRQLPTHTITLHVYEKIESKVTRKPLNETCRATLLCTTNQREHVSYHWKRGDQDLPEHAGILEVSLIPGEINVTFTCIASNPAIEATASIRESCAGDGKHWWWIYTAATIFLLLVFICIGMVVVLYKKKKRSKAVKETPEPQTIYAEIDRQSTLMNHVARPSNAQQSKSPLSTIYATVTHKQAPEQSCTSQYDMVKFNRNQENT